MSQRAVLLREVSAGILIGCCVHAAGSRCARVLVQRQFVQIFRKQSTSVSTYSPKPGDVTRTWHVIDAEDIVLGRLAVTAATFLRGKHKPTYAPHGDGGDFVIVVNASKVALTGNKRTDKLAYRHSGRPGGLKTTSYGDLLDSDPREAVERAVWGMLPKNKLSRKVISKLKVYAGPDHPHSAQKPQPYEITQVSQ